MSSNSPTRILVVDDNVGIHRDFSKVFAAAETDLSMVDMESALYGEDSMPRREGVRYELTFAESGLAALETVRWATQLNRRFAIAFVDMRMPGWDGTETIEQLWRVQPDLEVAICSAYMDYSWHDVLERLQRPGIRLIRKPWTSSQVLEVVQELTARRERRVVSRVPLDP